MHLHLLQEVFQSCSVEVVLKDEIILDEQFAWTENRNNKILTQYTGVHGTLTLLLDIRKLQEGVYSFAARLTGAEPFCCRALRFRLHYVNPDPQISRTCLHNHCTILSPRQRIPGK